MNGRITQRGRLFTAAIACTTLVSVSACGGGSSSNDTAKSGTIHLLGYSAKVEDNYKKAVIEPFEKKYPNIKVKYDAGDNAAKMLGTVRSEKDHPTDDVVLMDSSISESGHNEGLFEKLDKKDIPNIKNVVPRGRTKGGYAATFDSFQLLYNKQKMKKAPTSWGSLWDAPNDSLAIPAAPDIQGMALTRVVAKMQDKNYKKDITPAINKISKLRPKTSTWDPNPSSYQAITEKNDTMGIGWNARAQLFSKKSPDKLGTVVPKEGTLFQINTINLTKQSEHKKPARTFINYALSKKAQKSFAETMYYAPTVSGVHLNKDARKRVVSPKSKSLIGFDWSWMADHQDDWTKKWKREVVK